MDGQLDGCPLHTEQVWSLEMSATPRTGRVPSSVVQRMALHMLHPGKAFGTTRMGALKLLEGRCPSTRGAGTAGCR